MPWLLRYLNCLWRFRLRPFSLVPFGRGIAFKMWGSPGSLVGFPQKFLPRLWDFSKKSTISPKISWKITIGIPPGIPSWIPSEIPSGCQDIDSGISTRSFRNPPKNVSVNSARNSFENSTKSLVLNVFRHIFWDFQKDSWRKGIPKEAIGGNKKCPGGIPYKADEGISYEIVGKIYYGTPVGTSYALWVIP